MTELNGVGTSPRCRAPGQARGREPASKGMIAGQIEEAEAMVPGYLTPNRRMMYAALQWCTCDEYYPLPKRCANSWARGRFRCPRTSLW